MIKEEIIGKLIKDAAFAEYLIKTNLSEYDMAKLVCHAAISIARLIILTINTELLNP